jgi:hypothetical protein
MKMQVTIKICLVIAFIAVLFCSCWPYVPQQYYIPEPRQKQNLYYTPSTSNAPLLVDKNDFNFGFNYSSAKDYGSLDLNAAYVFAEHFGFAGGTSVSSNNKHTKNDKSELSLGYILPLNTQMHFETYSGIGWGTVNNKHETGMSTVKSNQIFIQPSLGIHNKENTIQFGIITRFVKSNFKVSDTTFSSIRESYSANQLNILRNEPSHYFLEPGATLKIGWPFLLVNLGYTSSLHVGGKEFARGKGNFSAGVLFKFNTGIKSSVKEVNVDVP